MILYIIINWFKYKNDTHFYYYRFSRLILYIRQQLLTYANVISFYKYYLIDKQSN